MIYLNCMSRRVKNDCSTVLPRSGNDLGIVDAYPVSHPVSIIDDVYN